MITTNLSLTDEAPYSLFAEEKTPRLLAELNQLTAYHTENCLLYQRLIQTISSTMHQAVTLDDLPYLNVRLFKHFALQSVPDSAIFKTLYSSGTTGQPSRIVLDKDAAALQSRVLVRIMQHWLGKERLPMLIIDHPGVVKDRTSFSARGAGIQGLAFMGRSHCYALNEDLSINTEALTEFCRLYGQSPVLIFGFTFMVWQWLAQLEPKQIQLPQAILLHSGGWKKLQAQAVGNAEFKARLAEVAAIRRVHNFYGMVEQIGAVFVECEHGHLHCPASADVLVRDPQTWQLQPNGQPGLLQLLSTLPRSYPGHSLLTEDRGVLLGEDNCLCGRPGKYFQVLGRLPLAEARGCSDTVVTAVK
ncbi:MAG: acyl-protein synthetase [Gammaproteobacteria bacterium]|nr:acyl-protein synthetase [Gammaproteobacteria bacterium]